jgi:IMP dehydrogenase
MGSLGAMQDNPASRQRYGERGSQKDRLVPEGIEGVVPYKGSVLGELHQQLEGLRRGMGYVGAATIQQLQRKAEFHRISPAGLRESHPHDVVITEDAPNYKRKEK